MNTIVTKKEEIKKMERKIENIRENIFSALKNVDISE